MAVSETMLKGLLGLALLSGAAPAQSEILTFHAKLDGEYDEKPSGSPATATARIKVDTRSQRVSVDMVVNGITTEDLWDKLVAAPIGPIHFHKYATPAGGDSVLVLPLPYGPSYKSTKRGMRVRVKDYDYVAGARLLKSDLSFDQFVAAMQSGLVILNIHTDKFNPGEISGRVARR